MMEGLNSNCEDGAIWPEMKPEPVVSDNLSIIVSHGLSQHQVVVPSNSTFGDLKSVITREVGLRPETYKLLFRGKEKEDDDSLQAAGVKDSSKVLIMEEDTESVQKSPEEVETSVTPETVETGVVPEKVETSVVSRGGEAVAIVRAEVDMLADQVAALQAVVDGGTKVDDKDFLYLSEMLMRQLLKLDGIEAEGDGKVQRKMEVHRVQSFVETVDILKSRNANDVTNNSGTAPVTSQLETFEPESKSVVTESTVPSTTATSIHVMSPAPAPASASASVMSSTNAPTPFPFSVFAPVPSSSPSHLPSAATVTQDCETIN